MLPDPLATLLRRYPSSVQPISGVLCLGNAGGLSGTSIWRYTALVGELAVRAWPAHSASATHLRQVHDWIKAADDPSLPPLSLPLPALDGQSLHEVAGRLWEIDSWLPGAPDLDRPPKPSHVRQAFTALARFHRRLSTYQRTEASPGLRGRLTELDELARGGFDRIESAIARHSGDGLAAPAQRWVTLARVALPRVLPALRDASSVAVPIQPCLRDARPEHFLFEGDRLTGLIDFGAMDFETVAADLARLFGEWLGGFDPLRAEALAAYERVRPLDDAERALIAPFEAAADLLIAGRWVSWHFLDRRTFEDPDAVQHGIARGLERLDRFWAASERLAH